MTYEEAAAITNMANTALFFTRDLGNIQAGQKVLINGASGGIGTFAVQLAKYFGAEVTAVDSGEKLDMLREIGADHVIDYTKNDFTENGCNYDLIFDVKTDRPVFDYQRSLTPHGIYATVGGKTSRILQVFLLGKFSKKHTLHIVGYKANKDSKYLVELFEAGKLKPVIDTCFPLEETAEAFRYFGKGRFKGKIVVTIKNT